MQTTISTPLKVKPCEQDFRVVASGLDTLVFTANVTWRDRSLFDRLRTLKVQAKEDPQPVTGELAASVKEDTFIFEMRPHGTKGYEWLLVGGWLTLRVGDWREPQSRPSVIVEIRSEALWTLGAKQAVAWALRLIEAEGGTVQDVKPSRVDLCADVLVPEDFWTPQLVELKVTRAEHYSPYFRNDVFSGVQIGRGGQVMARLYDKGLEIGHCSGKVWMYDVWGLIGLPVHDKAIRSEFQIRREGLTERGIDSMDDLWRDEARLWAYLTREWLKFQTRPGCHHTQRRTIPFWQAVQKGYKGAQDAGPLSIIKKARLANIEAMWPELFGFTTTIATLGPLGERIENEETVEPDDLLGMIWRGFRERGYDAAEIKKRMKAKLPRRGGRGKADVGAAEGAR